VYCCVFFKLALHWPEWTWAQRTRFFLPSIRTFIGQDRVVTLGLRARQVAPGQRRPISYLEH
jgi:hypothetical protein